MGENENNRPGDKPGLLTRIGRLFTRPSTRYGAGVLVIVGIIVGVIGWLSFETVVARSSTLEFCSTACHEMEAFVYPEYAERVHYRNASGVRAACADCHVPKPLVPKMVTKIRASLVEVPGHLLGRIDTAEKFEAHREEMAERVWARMKATDSRECRDCHSWEAMSDEAQARRAWRAHQDALEEGETCIDCHKGIAHQLPQSYLEPDEEELDFGF